MLGVVDDGRVEAVEGEEIGDLAVVILRGAISVRKFRVLMQDRLLTSTT